MDDDYAASFLNVMLNNLLLKEQKRLRKVSCLESGSWTAAGYPVHVQCTYNNEQEVGWWIWIVSKRGWKGSKKKRQDSVQERQIREQ